MSQPSDREQERASNPSGVGELSPRGGGNVRSTTDSEVPTTLRTEHGERSDAPRSFNSMYDDDTSLASGRSDTQASPPYIFAEPSSMTSSSPDKQETTDSLPAARQKYQGRPHPQRTYSSVISTGTLVSLTADSEGAPSRAGTEDGFGATSPPQYQVEEGEEDPETHVADGFRSELREDGSSVSEKGR